MSNNTNSNKFGFNKKDHFNQIKLTKEEVNKQGVTGLTDYDFTIIAVGYWLKYDPLENGSSAVLSNDPLLKEKLDEVNSVLGTSITEEELLFESRRIASVFIKQIGEKLARDGFDKLHKETKEAIKEADKMINEIDEEIKTQGTLQKINDVGSYQNVALLSSLLGTAMHMYMEGEISIGSAVGGVVSAGGSYYLAKTYGSDLEEKIGKAGTYAAVSGGAFATGYAFSQLGVLAQGMLNPNIVATPEGEVFDNAEFGGNFVYLD